jgi:hypothetical protein
MARKLNPEEAEVFEEGNRQPTPAELESFLRELDEKSEHALDLTLIPGKWFRSLPLRRPDPDRAV